MLWSSVTRIDSAQQLPDDPDDKMIISCHVPKTAGTTFHRALQKQFGPRLCQDYGGFLGWDWADQYTDATTNQWHRPESTLNQDFDCVHGHFYVKKYREMFPGSPIVAFLRHPVDRVISHYLFLKDNKNLPNPVVRTFHALQPSLETWIEWPWNQNMQSRILDGIEIEELAVVGLVEHYEASVARFDSRFGTNLGFHGKGLRLNSSSHSMPVSEKLRQRIASLNRADQALYGRAEKHFFS